MSSHDVCLLLGPSLFLCERDIHLVESHAASYRTLMPGNEGISDRGATLLLFSLAGYLTVRQLVDYTAPSLRANERD